MKNKFFVLELLLCTCLLGCGGGGGGSAGVEKLTTPPPLGVASTSYANKNNIVLDVPQIPSITTTSPSGSSVPESLTLGDFFQEGSYSAFVAVNQAGTSAKAYFLKKNTEGIWEDATTSLLTDRSVCTTIVQSITADLNGDGKPDVYVVCGGASAGAFKQVLFVSQPNDKTYLRQETSFTLQQAWGATAGDIDGDGDVDLVVSDNGQAIVLMNDGRGMGAASLSKDISRIPNQDGVNTFPTSHRKVFLLPRANAKPDLVIGGSGAVSNTTMVYLKNDGSGHYYLNHATGVSNVFEPTLLSGVTAQLYDVIETDTYLYVLAKNVPLESAASANIVSVIRYELPARNQSGSQLNLINLNGTELALPANPYSPIGGYVSQIKPNRQGGFVAFDAACVSGETRCAFSVTP
jgi:hypothetical protein